MFDFRHPHESVTSNLRITKQDPPTLNRQNFATGKDI